MFKQTILGVLFATSLVPLSSCAVDEGVIVRGGTIIEQDCAVDSDCPAGFECEIEAEHGTTVTYCKSHDEEAGACPAGYELELEHGQAYCAPHGDDGDSGSGGGPGSCSSDADCPTGYACESELEHGEDGSYCEPHGGS